MLPRRSDIHDPRRAAPEGRTASAARPKARHALGDAGHGYETSGDPRRDHDGCTGAGGAPAGGGERRATGLHAGAGGRGARHRAGGSDRQHHRPRRRTVRRRPGRRPGRASRHEHGATSTFATGLPVTGAGRRVRRRLHRRHRVRAHQRRRTGHRRHDVGGIYRVDDIDDTTLIADTANWSIENPPDADYFVPSGVQYAFVPFDDGFLVTDGHHNRLLFADLEGEVSEVAQFGNIVPTGLQVDGTKIYMAEAGPIPHDPATGRVVVARAKHPVERCRGIGLQPDRGRRGGVVRPLRAVAGRLARKGRARLAGSSRQRRAPARQRQRHVHGHRRRARPADIALVRRRHGVHRDARRRRAHRR